MSGNTTLPFELTKVDTYTTPATRFAKFGIDPYQRLSCMGSLSRRGKMTLVREGFVWIVFSRDTLSAYKRYLGTVTSTVGVR